MGVGKCVGDPLAPVPKTGFCSWPTSEIAYKSARAATRQLVIVSLNGRADRRLDVPAYVGPIGSVELLVTGSMQPTVWDAEVAAGHVAHNLPHLPVQATATATAQSKQALYRMLGEAKETKRGDKKLRLLCFI